MQAIILLCIIKNTLLLHLMCGLNEMAWPFALIHIAHGSPIINAIAIYTTHKHNSHIRNRAATSAACPSGVGVLYRHRLI